MRKVAANHFPGDDEFKRVGNDGNSALLVDGVGGFGERHTPGNGFGHPKRQNMTISGRDFDAGYDVEGILIAMRVGPETCLQFVVVGDRDHVKIATLTNSFKDFLNRRQSIADGGVHMQICATDKL